MAEEKVANPLPDGFPYHSIPVDEVFSLLDTSMQGLSSEEAAKRLVEHGKNELTPPIKPSFLMKYVSKLLSFITILYSVSYSHYYIYIYVYACMFPM